MCTLPREFNELELMINVMAEDSHWLDTFQNDALSRDTMSNSCNAKLQSIQNSSQAQVEILDQKPFGRKRNWDELDTVDNDSFKSCSLPQKAEEGSPAKHHRFRGILSAEQANDLPAPEFVISNRSEVASETMRIARAAFTAFVPDCHAHSFPAIK